MVAAGHGVALVPLLTAIGAGGLAFEVGLYPTNLPPRRIVALIPSQYLRIQPYQTFLDALATTGAALRLPPLPSTPPFLAAREEALA